MIQDSYTVTDLPPGTPVLVFAFLDVHADTPQLCGGSGCQVERRAMLSHTLASDSRDWSTPGSSDFRLQVLVAAVAGTPFPLRAEVSLPFCGGGSEGQLEGRLTFLLFDSTQGSITSCNGYATPVTPAASSSWGWVKARYR